MKHLFLVSHVPPRADLPMRHFIWRDGNTMVKDNLDDLAGQDIVAICYDPTPLLTRVAEESRPPLIPIVDLAQMCRLATGASRKDYKVGEEPWSSTNLIRSGYQERNERLSKVQQLLFGLAKETPEETDSLLTELVSIVGRVGSSIIQDLKSKGEWERFANVEVQAQQCCLKPQLGGISFDQKRIEGLVAQLDREIYAHRNTLQLKYGIFSRTQKSRIVEAVRESGATELAELIRNKSPHRALLKRYADKSNPHPLHTALHDEHRASRDKDTLIALCGHRENVFFPVFETMGTVTGRIQMRSPNIQNLRKKYRDVVCPSRGKELIYIDYDHFEARILAHVSGDPTLIHDVNAGKFYERLGSRILAEPERETWKVIFFLHCYGPLERDWKKLTQEVFDDATLADAVENAFSGYSKLRDYREQIESKALNDRFVSTALGNRRYLADGIERAPNWTLNQIIQGTASLILKEAICAAAELKDVDFLIPMHDAALFQVPKESVLTMTKELKRVFEEVMFARCPSVKASASKRNFTG